MADVTKQDWEKALECARLAIQDATELAELAGNAIKYGWYSEDEFAAMRRAINGHNALREAGKRVGGPGRECNHWEDQGRRTPQKSLLTSS
jgi:hypothetical protein